MADLKETQEKHREDTIARLKKYEGQVRHRLSSDVPEKHASAPEVFKAWLNSELKRTLRSIESLGG